MNLLTALFQLVMLFVTNWGKISALIVEIMDYVHNRGLSKHENMQALMTIVKSL